MNCANCNVKNVLKVLVKIFDSNCTIMISCDDKFIAKIGVRGCPLALCTKAKAGWVAEAVHILAADHNSVIKSNLFYAVAFGIDVPNNPNLSSFYKGDAHVGGKDSEILLNSSIKKIMNIG